MDNNVGFDRFSFVVTLTIETDNEVMNRRSLDIMVDGIDEDKHPLGALNVRQTDFASAAAAGVKTCCSGDSISSAGYVRDSCCLMCRTGHLPSTPATEFGLGCARAEHAGRYCGNWTGVALIF